MCASSSKIVLLGIFCIVSFTGTLGSPKLLNKQDAKQKQHHQPSNEEPKIGQETPIDTIFRDTFTLLDELDRKLDTVSNKTPSAMMRDNLRSLDDSPGATAQDSDYKLFSELGAKPQDEASIEAELLRNAESFSFARYVMNASPDRPGELIPDSSNVDESVERTAEAAQAAPQNPPFDRANKPKTARQLLAATSPDEVFAANESTERHIRFTLELMQAIFAAQGNMVKENTIESFLISPLNIQMVLMMMHLGARGATRNEIGACLHLPQNNGETSSMGGSWNNGPTIGRGPNEDNNSAADLGAMQQAGPTTSSSTTTTPAPLSPAAHSSGNKFLRRRYQQNVAPNSESNGAALGLGPFSAAIKPATTNAASSSRRQQQTAHKASTSASSSSSSQSSSAAGSGSQNAYELFSASMRQLLNDPVVGKSLTSANQIFLQKNLPLAPHYEWGLKNYFNADIRQVDFQHQTGFASSAQQSPLDKHSPASGQPVLQAPSAGAPSANPSAVPLNSKLSNSEHQQAREVSAGGGNIQQLINDWVERQTRGKICNFLSAPVSTSTLLMAINVLYFKGDWQYKFDPADTETDAWFTQADGKTVKVPMMVNRLPLAFAHDAYMKTSVIELPYKAQRLGLFLLLPDEVSGIFHTIQTLNATSFANLISSMRKTTANGADPSAAGVSVRIPKFSVDSSPRLSQILTRQLGLKSLFSPDMADLSGMFAQGVHKLHQRDSMGHNATAPPPQVGLDELLHKAVLQVDEQGSVAAAASATIVERVGSFNNNYFEADHPFLIFLMDKQTGLVLFSGVFAGTSNSSSGANGPPSADRH